MHGGISPTRCWILIPRRLRTACDWRLSELGQQQPEGRPSGRSIELRLDLMNSEVEQASEANDDS